MTVREPCLYRHEHEGHVFLCPYLADEPHSHGANSGYSPSALEAR